MFSTTLRALAILSLSVVHASSTLIPAKYPRLINVNLTDNRHLFVTTPPNDTVVTQMIVDTFALNSNVSQAVGGIATLTRLYQINTNVYIPPSGDFSSVILAIHRIGFDSQYWDFSASGDSTPYSFVDAALSKGYAVVSFDRLGTGKSSLPNGITDIQTGVEFLDARLKGKSVIGVGQSYGSILTNGIATKYPNDFSAIALTGYSRHLNLMGQAFMGLQPRIAQKSELPQFESLKDTSYLVSNGVLADQLFFFHFPGYTRAAFTATKASKSTFTLGETLTSAIPVQPAPDFKGPVLSVNGQFDNVFCGGNCYGGPNGTSLAVDLAEFFPLSAFSQYIAPNTGHGLAAHTSAPTTNAEILAWVKAAGF